jgi:hypothetical protein
VRAQSCIRCSFAAAARCCCCYFHSLVLKTRRFVCAVTISKYTSRLPRLLAVADVLPTLAVYICCACAILYEHIIHPFSLYVCTLYYYTLRSSAWLCVGTAVTRSEIVTHHLITMRYCDTALQFSQLLLYALLLVLYAVATVAHLPVPSHGTYVSLLLLLLLHIVL